MERWKWHSQEGRFGRKFRIASAANFGSLWRQISDRFGLKRLISCSQCSFCCAGAVFGASLLTHAWQLERKDLRCYRLCAAGSWFILCGRCSMWYSSVLFRVAGMALSASFCVILRGRCGPCRDTSALCVAGVALPSLLHHFTWQVWRLVRPKCSWRGRCSISSCSVSLRVQWQVWPSVGLHIAAIALLVAGAAFRACASLVRC